METEAGGDKLKEATITGRGKKRPPSPASSPSDDGEDSSMLSSDDDCWDEHPTILRRSGRRANIDGQRGTGSNVVTHEPAKRAAFERNGRPLRDAAACRSRIRILEQDLEDIDRIPNRNRERKILGR